MRDHAPLSEFRYGVTQDVSAGFLAFDDVSAGFHAFDALIAEMNEIVKGMSGAVSDAATTMQTLATEINEINPTECRALKELLTERLPTVKTQMEDLRNGLAQLNVQQQGITASSEKALSLAKPPSDDSSSVQDDPPIRI